MENYEATAIREWILEVMKTKEWSANKWATLAGTSPTNISRFLNGSKFVPSAKTLGKLSRVAGSSPSLSNTEAINIASMQVVPLFNDQLESIGSVCCFGLSGELKAFRHTTTNAGYQINAADIVVVKEEPQYNRGDLILFSQNLRLGLGSIIDKFTVFIPLTSQNFIQMKDIRVLGKVAQTIRNY